MLLGSALAAGAGTLVTTQIVAAAPIRCDAGSLIAAINTANNTAGAGTVTLAARCTYTFSTADNTADGNNALPVITGSVTINGNSATIARASSLQCNQTDYVDCFRFILVNDGASLNVNSLTFTNGAAEQTQALGGGAILNRGTLSVRDVTFNNNSAADPNTTGGGAIDNHGLGRLSVTTSTFNGNRATQGGAGMDEATGAGAHVSISQSTFNGNVSTTYDGGALESVEGTNDSLVADTFVSNRAKGGAAIYAAGAMSLDDSTFSNNQGSTDGGGAIQNAGQLTITRSTFSGNSSPYGANLHTYYLGTGARPLTSVAMSIASHPAGGGSSCSGTDPLTDAGYNIDDAASCGFSTANHSLNNTNPLLLALASNGGPTQTMALQPGSPAIDAIPTPVNGCSGTDQRGVTRPQGVACDIGAYELVTSTRWVQSAAQVTGSRVTSMTVTLSRAVHPGDLLVGWFGQYNATGNVRVGDNINGAWTRSASTRFGGGGDIALYYHQNARGAPSGLKVTVSAPASAYLEAAIGDYSGVALVGALDKVAVAHGVGAAVNSGPTGNAVSGELVVGGILTGGSPGGATAGSSRGIPFTMRAHTPSSAADIEDILASVAGAQNARATLAKSTDWYAVGAVFHHLSAPKTKPPTTPTSLKTTSVMVFAVSLSWNGAADNIGVAGHNSYRKGVTLATVNRSTAATYTDATVAPSTS